jgi:hypothetical protein
MSGRSGYARVAVILGIVVGAAACASSSHGSAGTAPGSSAPAHVGADPASDGSASAALTSAIAATRSPGDAAFTFENKAGTTRRVIVASTSRGVVDFGSGDTRFSYEVRNAGVTAALDVTVDEARAVGGQVYVRLPVGIRIAGRPAWAKLMPSKYGADVNITTPEQAAVVAGLLDALAQAHDVKRLASGRISFKLDADSASLNKLPPAAKTLIGGPNSNSGGTIDGPPGSFTSDGIADLDSAGRLRAVEIVSHLAILGAQGDLAFTFSGYRSSAVPGAPAAADVADRATICADRSVDIGEAAEPTANQLAAAGLLQQPAAWQLSYQHESGSSGYGASYQNSWCTALSG